MVTSTGILSFYPKLTNIYYSYNFTDSQKMGTNTNIMNQTVNQNEISQFSKEDGGYVIVIANYYIYLLNEKGKMIFNEQLTNIYAPQTLSLVAYKCTNNTYSFVIAYNMIDTNLNKKVLSMNYYSIFKYSENLYSIELMHNKNHFFNQELELNGLSCQYMNSPYNGKVLTCFESVKSDIYYLIAFLFHPDDECSYLYSSNLLENKIQTNVNYIKSSVNYERNFSIICYSIADPIYIRCIKYDINNNELSYTTLMSSACNVDYFGFDINYYMGSNHYLLTCLNNTKDQLTVIRVNSSQIIIDYHDFYSYSLTNCNNFYFYTVIYISEYTQYSVIITCEEINTKFYMLLGNFCKYPYEEEKEEEITVNTSPDKTIPQTLTKTTIPNSISITFPETTIPKIISTTLSETTIPKITSTTLTETTIPKIISTTLPLPDTTNPQILTKTTIPKIISSTLPETTILQILQKTTIHQILTTTLPQIIFHQTLTKTTIPQIISTTKTTIPKINQNEISTFEYSTEAKATENEEKEILCEDSNKIYYNGKCICDSKKGYFEINDNYSNNNCYKPKNIYFNNITQTYEPCFMSCETCNKEGNYLENNCLTCAYNYIKESNASSNCVEECKYFYYYDSLNQYSCTEEEQCPNEASLKVRGKKKCVNSCVNDDTNKYQFNGECLSSCPENTKINEFNICQLNITSICSSSDFQLQLEETIVQENIKLVAKNYAKEFDYTVNHISTFISSNFVMVLYKNSSCINELNLNITKIEYDSCIQKLKRDNNIDLDKKLIIAIIDIITGEQPYTSYGFFDPDTGEKLDASKSCSDKNVMMFENVLPMLKNPLAIELLQKQKINIFDQKNPFYRDICFHFDSPNGKDPTLQDRIKLFDKNITLCNPGCKNKEINLTTMEAECECPFQDLLSKKIYDNDLFGNNFLIKESLDQINDILNNLNLEILACYKDVFDLQYFKKNIGGFLIITIFILYSICIIYFFMITKNKIIRLISYLIDKIIPYNKNNRKNFHNLIKNHAPQKKKQNHQKKIKSKDKIISNKANKGIINLKNKTIRNNKKEKNKKRKKIYFKQINIVNVNFESKNKKSTKESSAAYYNSRSSIRFMSKNKYMNLIPKDMNIKDFLEPTFNEMDYDDVVEEDKRTFCQYYCQKIKENQMIINIFFTSNFLRPKSIIIAVFIISIDNYFLINGLFYSNSCISEKYNSTKEETFFSFIPRLLDRFFYCSILLNIIAYIIKLFFLEEIMVKKIILSNKNDSLKLKYELTLILDKIINY